MLFYPIRNSKEFKKNLRNIRIFGVFEKPKRLKKMRRLLEWQSLRRRSEGEQIAAADAVRTVRLILVVSQIP